MNELLSRASRRSSQNWARHRLVPFSCKCKKWGPNGGKYFAVGDPRFQGDTPPYKRNGSSFPPHMCYFSCRRHRSGLRHTQKSYTTLFLSFPFFFQTYIYFLVILSNSRGILIMLYYRVCQKITSVPLIFSCYLKFFFLFKRI